ncbi:trifunctional dihydropteroate synthetase [Tieghemiomyces parasiticus]|uniref:Folic acid synthesis protein FOL1 n=1 Tax=Tieghemiomyces parasiticus TaxID=78921 RepID=A0A9W8A240_9FUNG|nr:trifunctional dihydropteroate synthetase [Tieghemiomyces parasiticus]
MEPLDQIVIRNLTLRNIIGVDSWERVKRQPVVVSVQVATESIEAAARHDRVADTVNYGTLCKAVTAFSEASAFRSVEALAFGILRICLDHPRSRRATVKIEKPSALLHAAAAGVELTRTREEIPDLVNTAQVVEAPMPANRLDRIFVRDLRLSTVVGVNPWEREATQIVVVNLDLWVTLSAAALTGDHVPEQHNYRTIVRTVSQYVEQSRFKTVEALASAIARISILRCQVDRITVRVEKPSALSFAEGAGVEITRTRQSVLGDVASTETPAGEDELTASAALPHTAYIALGSNLGDSVGAIHQALDRLHDGGHIQVLDTSFLYRTEPMYNVDQPQFLNCVVRVDTRLSPARLLGLLKGIEVDLGRDLEQARLAPNGPRPIDLDILLYDRQIVDTPDLQIPHPRIAERLFVLFPLCDLAPHVEHPTLFQTCRQLLKLRLHVEPASGIERAFPLAGRVYSWRERTYLMGILNCTPDSFSDGGRYSDPQAALAHALQLVANGTDFIDIGGQSTRPNAIDVVPADEIARVIPVVQLLRESGVSTPLSIDTFRSEVAEAALAAGADMLNDVSAGTRDPRILAVAARYRVPICLMHMRGDARTMMGLTDYEETSMSTAADPSSVVRVVASELQSAVQRALRAGIYRWHIIVDPGIGFAKTLEQDLDLLRHLPHLTDADSPLPGFPVLVGTSRKKFIGRITDKEVPADRIWGTAATCAAAVAGGCRILRVHDVAEMRDVVKVSDRIWSPTV